MTAYKDVTLATVIDEAYADGRLAKLILTLEAHSVAWCVDADLVVGKVSLYARDVMTHRDSATGAVSDVSKWQDVTEWDVRRLYEWLGY
jgi:hypothetical protein